MFRLIEKLRKKNSSQRKALALLVSGTAVLLIFTVWSQVGSLPFTNSSLGHGASASSYISPLSSLKKSFSSVFQGTFQEFQTAKKNIEGSFEKFVRELDDLEELEKESINQDSSDNFDSSNSLDLEGSVEDHQIE